jgi:hypothetical protein
VLLELTFQNYGKSVGRLNFFVEMNQVTNVAVIFKELKFRNLRPVSKVKIPLIENLMVAGMQSLREIWLQQILETDL